MGWECGTYGRQNRCVKVLVERSKERRPLGKRNCRLEGYNKMNLSEVRRSVDWINLDQDRNRWRAFVIFGNKPCSSIKYGEFLG